MKISVFVIVEILKENLSSPSKRALKKVFFENLCQIYEDSFLEVEANFSWEVQKKHLIGTLKTAIRPHLDGVFSITGLNDFAASWWIFYLHFSYNVSLSWHTVSINNKLLQLGASHAHPKRARDVRFPCLKNFRSKVTALSFHPNNARVDNTH